MTALGRHDGRSRRTRQRRGITLIEVMVAMAILAIVATLMYTGFAQTARNKRRIEHEVDRHHEIRLGLERIARELSMAYMSDQLNPSPALQVVQTGFVGKEGGHGSRVDFTSFSHRRLYRDAHESDQNELSYFLTDHPEDSSRTVLARREQRRIDDDFRKGGSSQILIEDVESFELSYLDPLSGEWTGSWDSTQAAMQFNRLPSQVRIVIEVPNVRGKGPDEKFGTRAWIPLRFALNHATYQAK
ncbi:MAG: prepilin-type N-terminal cleavage/methylation domain-containing protein [Myxococcales bacterium]|nr:prepilin-type N-terminal cleavage/methylation domain-containing protein [Myxococcales bacterium]